MLIPGVAGVVNPIGHRPNRRAHRTSRRAAPAQRGNGAMGASRGVMGLGFQRASSFTMSEHINRLAKGAANSERGPADVVFLGKTLFYHPQVER